MPKEDYLPAGIMGFEAGKERGQKDVAFNLDVEQAQQNLMAKSLEIQDFIDATESRQAVRKTQTERAKMESRLMPEEEAATSQLYQAQKEQQRLQTIAMQEEEFARPLFGLNADNYEERYATLPDDVKKKLNTTGKWQDDQPRIMQTREAAINNAAHMRSLDLAGIKTAAKGGDFKNKAISLARKNEEAVNSLLSGDNVFNSLSGDDVKAYRSNVTYLAMDLYQRHQDAIRANPNLPFIPFTQFVQQVKAIADKHVSGEGSLIQRMFNTNEFDQAGFQADVATQLGIGIPKKAIDALQAGADEVQAGIDVTEGPQAAIPPDVRAGINKAASVIRQARVQQGIPASVPDHAIFNALVRQGYLSPDGTKASEKQKAKPKSTQP